MLRILLILIGLLMMVLSFVPFMNPPNAFQGIISVLLFGFGLLAVASAGVINALVQIRKRLPEPPTEGGVRITG